MALVSPGIELTVTDESQYVSAAVGTVPLVVMATAENKVINGAVASGTTANSAGQLQIFSSQRELVSALGNPLFERTAAGTPVHGSELNEYGLMAAYSALGASNRLYAIRADVDLDALVGTSVRPTGQVTDGTYWFDLSETSWGIFEWNSASQRFVTKDPIVITSENSTVTRTDIVELDGANVLVPLSSIGQVGAYAVVVVDGNNRIFYKNTSNQWVLVGSTEWQDSWATVIGSVFSPTVTSANELVINGETVTFTGGNLAQAVTDINNASIDGVTAAVTNDQRLALFVNDTANSGAGTVTIQAGTPDAGAELGISADTYYSPILKYGSYVSVPSWNNSSVTPRLSGSVWLKTGALGGGSDFSFKVYNSLANTWTPLAVPVESGTSAAIATLDPTGGGGNIALGTVVMTQDPTDLSINPPGLAGFRARVRTVAGPVKSVAQSAPSGLSPFTVGHSFRLNASGLDVSSDSVDISLSGVTAESFVSDILSANVPFVTAAIEANGAISITHLAGGNIVLTPITGTALDIAGFTATATNLQVFGTARLISGFAVLDYTYAVTEPFADPVDGTLWYYNDATAVDIMISDGLRWRGYRTVTADARGYNLTNTDPNGVIVSASRPTAQSDNTALAAGDLWLNTSDLDNYPVISRWNGASWERIDNTDQISQNGIVFADARWDATINSQDSAQSYGGLLNPVSDELPVVTELLVSNYVDLDAPDARLYPRGTLMFNTRRSGFNVKRFVSNYFDALSYTDLPAWNDTATYAVGERVVFGNDIYVATGPHNAGEPNPGALNGWAPLETGTWVSASGNRDDGAMYAGSAAQRVIVVQAMRAALEGNSQIREDQFQFNLIAAPGYPELITNMVALNNDRANTAFVIGDTPMTLRANVVDITNWSTGASADGLVTSDPYLGVYYPSALSNDVQGNTIMVPSSHVALRTYIRNDNVSYPWFAPAGTRRGLVDNAFDLGYLDSVTGEFVRTGVSQGLRDSLYSLNINPITILTGVGLVVWGQKTRNPTTSALDRVNVARLVNYIRTVLANAGNGFLFEPNDKITRDQLKQIIESAMNDLVAKRGIYDYLVVCDSSNNTPDRIARNELYVDIAIEPMKGVEFIYIPIRLQNPGTISGAAAQ